MNVQDTLRTYNAGDTIAHLVALWCPEQSHQETARQELVVYDSPSDTVMAAVDEYL